MNNRDQILKTDNYLSIRYRVKLFEPNFLYTLFASSTSVCLAATTELSYCKTYNFEISMLQRNKAKPVKIQTTTQNDRVHYK